MKIRSVEAELFHSDGRTERHMTSLFFRNFANVPKNCIQLTFRYLVGCEGTWPVSHTDSMCDGNRAP